MQIKAPNPLNLLKEKSTLPLIEVYFSVNHLKQLYRQGWLDRHIPPEKCESVADHIFGVALLAMIIAEYCRPELDMVKLLKMALIHDIGEIFTGDITPEDEISSDEKFFREKTSIARIFEPIHLENEYLELWEEYENGESLESQFVQQIDKLEMALQASIYEEQESKNLDDFFTTARNYISHPELREIFEKLEDLRK